MKVAVIYNKRQAMTEDVINIFGPQTKEKYNPKTVDRVASALEKGGHNVKVIEGNINVADELRSFMPRVISGERPGMVFNMAYGIQGQSRYTHIPAMLEMLGVPYIGSGPQAHGVALDKIMSKIVFKQHNLPTPDFWFFSSPDEVMENVTFPVIVKPKMEAVSMGLRIVHNPEDLREAVKYVIETFQQQALVEAFISGREFAIGVLGNGSDLEVLPIVEFDFHGDPNAIQSQENKLKKPVEKICPANIPDELAEDMRGLARGAFDALGIFDFARVDLRMDSEGKPYILELNSMASLGLTGSYVNSAKVAGYTYDSMINRMLDVAAVRYFGRESIQTSDIAEKKEELSQPLRVRLRTYIRSNLVTMADNLRLMVEMNSYVYNSEGVNLLGNWVAARLGKLGFQRQVFPQAEVGNMLYFTNHQESQNGILLLTHLDTFSSYQDYVPFREERGRYYGTGVAESKGGLTILLAALQALRFARRLKGVRCGILLTSDDTLGGRFSKRQIEDIARGSQCVAGLKHGGTEGGIVTSCSGSAIYNIEMTNVKNVKMNRTPDVVTRICQKVVAWSKLADEQAGVILEPRQLEARTIPSMAPDVATVSLYTQFKDKTQYEKLNQEIRQIAQKGLESKYQIRVRKGIDRHPVIETKAIRQFYERVQKMAERLEVKIGSFHRETSSDICYVPEEIPVLEGLGPAGGGARTASEYVLRDSLVDRATLLSLMIREFGRED